MACPAFVFPMCVQPLLLQSGHRNGGNEGMRRACQRLHRHFIQWPTPIITVRRGKGPAWRLRRPTSSCQLSLLVQFVSYVIEKISRT